MKKNLTKKQKIFCKYYAETEDAYHSAIKAGYSSSTIEMYVDKWLETPHILDYIEELKKISYSFKEYINDLNRVMELAFKTENPALLIKIIEAKGKAFGFDKITPSDLRENNKNIIKQDLFSRIKEKAHVFEKLEQNDITSDLSSDNS